ncbi:U32 family peptidase [Ruminococcus sp. HUN007]|uniref:U32 family peptidase n=1 Tax=Ruminococcus sp. HUN007 TaxID=1514668 RepID=UPI000B244816|nr:U32 family peptidase [Ruminococcus sp. HUN007]
MFLTCNTLPRNNEIPLFEQFVREAVEAGVDALIAADLGIISLIKKYAPDMVIHRFHTDRYRKLCYSKRTL